LILTSRRPNDSGPAIPAAALGTCRYAGFKKSRKRRRKTERLFEVFQAHNIRYFFYIGGNDSQDTSNKIHEEAVKRAYEMRVIGVLKPSITIYRTRQLPRLRLGH
jgi:6-phosphofructokinase